MDLPFGLADAGTIIVEEVRLQIFAVFN